MNDRIARLTVNYQGVETDYVLASDYENLEAEVERLRADLAAVKAQLVRVDDALVVSEAEVEKLRKKLATHQEFIRRHFLSSVFSAEAETLLKGEEA
jgi:predicted  nucleic acid-binding Zn-ribbon protein